MPYIESEQRQSLDPAIDDLVERMNRLVASSPDHAAYAGLLNYTCTRIALGAIPERRYASIATVTGVFHNIISEFYRRFAVPYEEEKISQHGDVYPNTDA